MAYFHLRDPSLPATWRGVSALCSCCGDMVLSFDLLDGRVVRLRLASDEVVNLIGGIGDMIAVAGRRCVQCPACLAQPASVSGSPAVDVSIAVPDVSTAENVALLVKSSSAEGAE